MLRDDALTYYTIWLLIETVRMVTPSSIAITILRAIGHDRFRASPCLEHLALVETLFFICFHLPRLRSLDSLAPAHTQRTRTERQALFDRCVRTVPDIGQWLSIWFKETPLASICADDVKLFLSWGFLNKHTIDSVDHEELEGYLDTLQERAGIRFRHGEQSLELCRVSADAMPLQHKSLLFYAVR